MKNIELAVYVPSHASLSVDLILGSLFSEDDDWASWRLLRANPEAEGLRLIREIQRIHNLRPRRLYFGTEVCERLIPSLPAFSHVVSFAHDRGLSLSLVTPPITDDGMKRLRPLLERAVGLTEQLEVVVNDFGVLRVLSLEYPGLRAVLGRLLNRMRRMVRYTRAWPQMSPAQLDMVADSLGSKDQLDSAFPFHMSQTRRNVLRSSSIELGSYVEYLTKMGVTRIEFDAVPQGILVEPSSLGMTSSIYYPWVYITSGRVCEMGSMFLSSKEKFRINGQCGEECKEYSAVWSSDWPYDPETIIERGNAVFALTNWEPALMLSYLERHADRIVYEPMVPV